MTIVKLRLDLSTPKGRAGMRGYLRAIEEFEEDMCEAERRGPDALTVEKLRAGLRGYAPHLDPDPEEPNEDRIPAFLRPMTELPPRQDTTEGVATREGIEQPEASASLEAAATGEASPRCSGSEGADARPQQSLQAEPDLPPAGADNPGPERPVESGEPACKPAQADLAAEAEALRGDPDRPWTDELRSTAWAMYEAGWGPAEVAERLNLRKTRVASFIGNIRSGNMRKPQPPAGGAQLPVPAAFFAETRATVSIRDERRPPAQDAEMQAARLEEMAEAERGKAVTRSIYPEVFP